MACFRKSNFSPGLTSSVFMASVDRKIWYRNQYLKSQHWDNLRLRKLVSSNGLCSICRLEGWNHDVHHIRYKNLFDVNLSDLAVLCRSCHNKAHVILAADPSIKKHPNPWWKTIRTVMVFRKRGMFPEQQEAKRKIKEAVLRCVANGKLSRRCKYTVSKKFRDAVVSGFVLTDDVVCRMITRPYKTYLLSLAIH